MVKIAQNAVLRFVKFLEIPCKISTAEVEYCLLSWLKIGHDLLCKEGSCTVKNARSPSANSCSSANCDHK